MPTTQYPGDRQCTECGDWHPILDMHKTRRYGWLCDGCYWA
jgi:hypothetical protein